jgi:hypothetical protein
MMDDELQTILEKFASNFAHHHKEDGDDYWWGHDTNLGTQSLAFGVAKRSIRAFKKRHLPHEKSIKKYAELGYLNRKGIAKAIWGTKVPGWWPGSTAEFEVLKAIARARS